MSQLTSIIPNIPLADWYDKKTTNSIEDTIVNLIIEKLSPGDQPFPLRATLQDIPNPETMKGVLEAVDLLLKSIDRGEKILIVGDYDVDGITSTALLSRFFIRLGLQNFEQFIPNRFIHG
jgi:hypothetical protein